MFCGRLSDKILLLLSLLKQYLLKMILADWLRNVKRWECGGKENRERQNKKHFRRRTTYIYTKNTVAVLLHN
jgi:hypothetical protein